MLSIEEALKLTTESEVETEIKERVELRSRMVGTLYPHVLSDEIHKLYQLIDRMWASKRKDKDASKVL